MSNFIDITTGEWEGVSFRILEAKVLESNGEVDIAFDYEVLNLPDSKSVEFEKYLGNLLRREIENEVAKDGLSF